MKLFIALCTVFLPVLVFAADVQQGKKLFVTRTCNACHAIGTEGVAVIGPNLAGVLERRDKAWLTKWLKNPDAMRNDPEIQKMLATYHAPMPNLGLSATEVDDLLAYLGSMDQKPKK